MCLDDTDRIEWMERMSVTVYDKSETNNFFSDVVGEYWEGGLRWHIDSYSSMEFMMDKET